MKIYNINYYNSNLYKYPKPAINFSQAFEYKIIYDNAKHLEKIKFSNPVSLKDVCEILMKPEHFSALWSFNLRKSELNDLKTSKFADIKIKELLGYGAVACAFLLDNGNVMKITCGEHLRRAHEDFDIPIYEQGILLSSDESYNIHYYIEQYADTENVLEEEVLELINKITAKGYQILDVFLGKHHGLNISQFGKTKDGKVYLLDPECAQKK